MCAARTLAISHASPQDITLSFPWGFRGMGVGWGGGREQRDTTWWDASYHMGPQAHYIDRRMELLGLDVGDKLLSRKFVEPVELLGAIAARAEAAHKLGALSPGLGIPSDLSIIWDGVSIGARNFSRYESLYLIGVVFMEWPQASRGSLAPGVSREPEQEGTLELFTRSCFLVGPSAGQKHTGQEQADLILSALATHPAALTTQVLRARLAVVGSDGAAAKGGPNSVHTSTGGSELVWGQVHPNTPPVAEWDLFHRIDLATTKACKFGGQ